MGVISLSDVKPAPAEAVVLYDKYRPLIAQGAPAEKLKQKLLADCTALKAKCDIIVGQLSRQIFMPFIMNLVNVCSSHEHTIPFIA